MPKAGLGFNRYLLRRKGRQIMRYARRKSRHASWLPVSTVRYRSRRRRRKRTRHRLSTAPKQINRAYGTVRGAGSSAGPLISSPCAEMSSTKRTVEGNTGVKRDHRACCQLSSRQNRSTGPPGNLRRADETCRQAIRVVRTMA